MIGDCRRVVVRDGQAALNVNQVADERGVEDEALRTHLVAGHAFGERGDFVGGECYVPDADFGGAALKKGSIC